MSSSPPDLVPGLSDEPEPSKTGRRRRIPRTLVVIGLLLLVLVLILAGGVYFLTEKYAGQVDRLPGVFAKIPEQQRPDKPTSGAAEDAVTFLVAGVDTHSDVNTTGAGASGSTTGRSDALMLVHVTGDRERINVVSIPRDTWVSVPGHGHAKINAAYAYGGPTLAVRTVENLTGVRIDHFAVIDFAGFEDLTDALGGVTVTIPEDSYDKARHHRWRAGRQQLSGSDALDYVGQRYGLPRGDISRTHRQQQFLRALARKLLDAQTLTHPLELANVVGAITDTATVDDGLSNGEMRRLAFSVRGIRGGDMSFMTAPVSGLGREAGGQSVVYLDTGQAKRVWDALERDRLDRYLQRYGGDTLGGGDSGRR